MFWGVEVRFVENGLSSRLRADVSCSGWILVGRDRCVDGLSNSLSSFFCGCWLFIVF